MMFEATYKCRRAVRNLVFHGNHPLLHIDIHGLFKCNCLSFIWDLYVESFDLIRTELSWQSCSHLEVCAQLVMFKPCSLFSSVWEYLSWIDSMRGIKLSVWHCISANIWKEQRKYSFWDCWSMCVCVLAGNNSEGKMSSPAQTEILMVPHTNTVKVVCSWRHRIFV